MEGKEIVSLKSIWFSSNEVPILEDINFSIKQNAFLAIVGPNGGGKTTLLKVILGLIKPTEGDIRVFGRRPEEGRKLIGYLPQHTSLDFSFPINIFDTVLMGRYAGLFKGYSKEDKEAATRALKTVEMLKLKDRQIGQLSSGQLQRVFIARALAREPSLLLLDEPMASIDPELQESFYKLLSKLRERMAIVLVSHDVGVVSTQVDEIVCLNRRLLYHGSVKEGLEHLAEVYEGPIDLIEHGAKHKVLRRYEK